MVNGEKIARIMKEKGIRSNDLADRVGISPAMMSYITRGFREPNVSILVRIAKELECKIDELIEF